jgi:peroxiredoxin
MSLREKLEEQWLRTQSEEIRQGYDALVAQLAASGMAQASLKAGDQIPDFELPSLEGRLVGSAELLSHGSLVLSFFRGGWCPYCTLELSALQEALPDIEARGATAVAITPDTGPAFAAIKRDNRLDFDILSDVDYGLALLFGIVFKLPDRLRDLYLRLGIDLGARHGNRHPWLLPVPATYIVDRRGIITGANVDPDFRRRMEPVEIIEVLDRMVADPNSRGDVKLIREVSGPGQP